MNTILFLARCPNCGYENEYLAIEDAIYCPFGHGQMLTVCPECGNFREDDRTKSGMKCARCAY